MRKHWKAVLLACAVAAIALSVVAVAYGATTKQMVRRGASAGACGALMSNPQALTDMQALRAEHQQDMRTWTDRYGADPSSAEAQAALQKLRQEHWNDMRGLFKKFGGTVQQGAGAKAGNGGCGGGCGASGSTGTTTGGGMMGGGWSY